MRGWSTFVIAALLFVAVLMTRGPALPSRAAEADFSTFPAVVHSDTPAGTLTVTPDNGGIATVDRFAPGLGVETGMPGWRGVIEGAQRPTLSR
jgi:hypothetical protein